MKYIHTGKAGKGSIPPNSFYLSILSNESVLEQSIEDTNKVFFPPIIFFVDNFDFLDF